MQMHKKKKGVKKMKIDKTKYELAKARACISSQDIIAAGIPAGTVSGILRGNVRPETAGKIAKILGVEVTEIIEQ